MSDINFRFIGWCKEDNHDKVWASFEMNGAYYCAWGARGKKLQFKKHTAWSLSPVERKKKDKYKPIDSFFMFSLFPDFEEKLSQNLMMATLMNTIK